MRKTKGKVRTVLGALNPNELGITLMHEHTFINHSNVALAPKNPRESELANQRVQLSNLWWNRTNPVRSFDNLVVDEEATLVEELLCFKALGGGTIVDVTPQDTWRDAVGDQRLARLTCLNIVCGTAHYLAPTHPTDMSARSVLDLAREFVREIDGGIGATGIRAGIIGEIGCSSPIHANERKCLEAAVRAQVETGAPISIHPGRSRDSPLQIAKLLIKEGAEAEKVIIGHIENRLPEIKEMETLADEDCFVEIDAFGLDHLPFGANPSDERRVEILARLVEDGYTDNILISQDVCLKTQLRKYGGFGYGHILENMLPLMQKEGISEEEIYRILVENPMRVLAF